MDKDIYLISAQYVRDAEKIAESYSLRLGKNAVHIPIMPRERRATYLKGRKVSDASYLIGFFTREETDQLLERKTNK